MAEAKQYANVGLFRASVGKRSNCRQDAAFDACDKTNQEADCDELRGNRLPFIYEGELSPKVTEGVKILPLPPLSWSQRSD